MSILKHWWTKIQLENIQQYLIIGQVKNVQNTLYETMFSLDLRNSLLPKLLEFYLEK